MNTLGEVDFLTGIPKYLAVNIIDER